MSKTPAQQAASHDPMFQICNDVPTYKPSRRVRHGCSSQFARGSNRKKEKKRRHKADFLHPVVLLQCLPLFYVFGAHHGRRNNPFADLNDANVSEIAERTRLTLASSFHELSVKSYGISSASRAAWATTDLDPLSCLVGNMILASFRGKTSSG